jgi:hypothetical protein
MKKFKDGDKDCLDLRPVYDESDVKMIFDSLSAQGRILIISEELGVGYSEWQIEINGQNLFIKCTPNLGAWVEAPGGKGAMLDELEQLVKDELKNL